MLCAIQEEQEGPVPTPWPEIQAVKRELDIAEAEQFSETVVQAPVSAGISAEPQAPTESNKTLDALNKFADSLNEFCEECDFVNSKHDWDDALKKALAHWNASAELTGARRV